MTVKLYGPASSAILIDCDLPGDEMRAEKNMQVLFPSPLCCTCGPLMHDTQEGKPFFFRSQF
jgi:hypothetical protein